MSFFKWFKVGSLSALLALLVAWGGIVMLSPLMPDRPAKVEFHHLDQDFSGKQVQLVGRRGEMVAGLLEGGTQYRLQPLLGESEHELYVVIPKELEEKGGKSTETGATFHGTLSSGRTPLTPNLLLVTDITER